MTTREPHESSRREGRERDSHGRRPHSSYRSRRDDPRYQSAAPPSDSRSNYDLVWIRMLTWRHRGPFLRLAISYKITQFVPLSIIFWNRFGSPRRRRDDKRHESDRAHYRSRDEESAKVSDRDQKRNRDAEQRDDPPNAESKSVSDAKNDPSTRHERSPRGTKRFSESRETLRHRSFVQVLFFSPFT